MIRLLIGLFFIANCSSKIKYPQTVTSMQYELDSKDNAMSTGDTIAIEYFNEKRQLVKKITRNKTELGIIEKTIQYDSEGREITFITKYGDLHTTRTDGLRDKFGNITQMKTYELNSKDTTIDVFTYEFNNDSTIINSKMLSITDSAVKGYYEELYDNKRHLIQRTLRAPVEQGKITVESIESYTYDDWGNKTSSTSQDLLNNNTTKTIFVYGGKDKLLKESFFKNDSLIYELDYQLEGDRKIEAIKNMPLLKKKFKILFIYRG